MTVAGNWKNERPRSLGERDPGPLFAEDGPLCETDLRPPNVAGSLTDGYVAIRPGMAYL